MPTYTIETTYRLPVYRQKTYSASTLEAACEIALHDGDWSAGKEDVDTAGEAYVSGAWAGADNAYRGGALPISAQFLEIAGRMQEHFPVLLRCLKEAMRGRTITTELYATIVKADSIISGAADPNILALMETPWGQADDIRILDDGLLFCSTPSHGGFHLDAERNALIQEGWRSEDGRYEEDCEWAKVAVTFPQGFDDQDLEAANKVIGHFYRRPDMVEGQPLLSHTAMAQKSVSTEQP